MKKILWKLLERFDDNWGYTTPLQKRFEIGKKCFISAFKTNGTKFEIGEEVTVIETGRHDYLVENENGKAIVYQFELI
jgi:hypothetical protein